MAERTATERASESRGARWRDRVLPFGSLAFAGALGSLVTCYGSIFLATLFGVEALGLNPHVQAVIMWGFGVLALYAMWRDRGRHQRTVPLVVGAGGVAVLLFTLYVEYDMRFEILAYVLLVVAALLNQNAMIGALYDTVVRQADQISDFNRTLEDRVERQVREIGRLSRLKNFLAPSVAELVVAEDKEALLDSHRQYIACLFCDIRNFTAASERLEPEETIALLQTFHKEVGALVAERNGTIGYRAGDGLMVFFNDPIPCDEPVLDAVKLALDIRDVWPELRRRWQRLGHSIGVGIGIASGYATLGLVGDEGRTDYTAIGNGVNVAARLCEQAQDGEILIDQRAYLDVEDRIDAVSSDARMLKGVGEPVEVHNVRGLKASSAA